jgi:hypothetical protein
MSDVPKPLSNDSEDVVWALQTADTLFSRGDVADAVVWLNRAARAARDGHDPARAQALAECANTMAAAWETKQRTRSMSPAQDVEVEIEVSNRPGPLGSERPRRSTGAPALSEAPLSGGDVLSMSPESAGDVAVSAPPAPAVPKELAPAKRPPPLPPPLPKGIARKPASPAAVAPPGVASALAPLQASAPVAAAPVADAPVVAAPVASAQPDAASPASARKPDSVAPRMPLPFQPPETDVKLPLSGTGEVPSLPMDQAPGVNLDAVEAFADLPEEARLAFGQKATVSSLVQGEEVPFEALAYITRGSVFVSASMVDAPAKLLSAGTIVRNQGTIEAALALRLIAGEGGASVACWAAGDVTEALASCPWVDDELRLRANEILGICGITIGALGERLDLDLLSQVTARLETRVFEPGDVIAEKGKPMGIAIVALGDVLIDNEASLSCGDLLFPEGVLSAAPARETVRAGASGALVLMGPRSVAQELMMTCPPLVEIFAGM